MKRCSQPVAGTNQAKEVTVLTQCLEALHLDSLPDAHSNMRMVRRFTNRMAHVANRIWKTVRLGRAQTTDILYQIQREMYWWHSFDFRHTPDWPLDMSRWLDDPRRWWFPHEVKTPAAAVTQQEQLRIRLFVDETIIFQVCTKAGTSYFAIVHQTCKHQ